jgi:WD40 repeat protein
MLDRGHYINIDIDKRAASLARSRSMIVDTAASDMRAVGAISRRGVLVLAAAGLLAACAPARGPSTRASATPLPRPLAPAAPIAPGSAARVAQLALLAPADGRARGAAWSPDGGTVAAGAGSDVHLWDTASGRALGVLRGHADQIYALAWSPANGLLASASDDHSVRVWDPTQGTARLVLGAESTASNVYSVSWSPDGTRVVAGTRAGDVVLWDAATGARLGAWGGPPRPPASGRNPYAVWGVSWSPDGRRIVSNRYDGLTLLWNAGSGALLGTIASDSQPNTVAWSPDGSRFATTHDDGTTQLWDGATYRNMAVFHADPAEGWAYGLAWSPDGSLLATSYESGSVQIWDVQNSTALIALTAHRSEVWGLAWSRDGLRLASASDDSTVRLWGVR